MYTERFEQRHKIGLERLTGGNRGLVFCNERTETVLDENDQETQYWVYDVYEVSDARSPKLAKNSIIDEQHPFGDENKILRKALSRVLKKLGEYESQENAEFREYDEFVESLEVKAIKGSTEAPLPTEEELMEAARKKKLSQISTYDSSANVNVFLVSGQPMWLSFDERSRLKASLEAAEALGQSTMTKFFAGLRFEFPLAAWRQMINAVEAYAGECLNITATHKKTVEALDNLESIENYDYTVGYPEKLEF